MGGLLEKWGRYCSDQCRGLVGAAALASWLYVGQTESLGQVTALIFSLNLGSVGRSRFPFVAGSAVEVERAYVCLFCASEE